MDRRSRLRERHYAVKAAHRGGFPSCPRQGHAFTIERGGSAKQYRPCPVIADNGGGFGSRLPEGRPPIKASPSVAGTRKRSRLPHRAGYCGAYPSRKALHNAPNVKAVSVTLFSHKQCRNIRLFRKYRARVQRQTPDRREGSLLRGFPARLLERQ